MQKAGFIATCPFELGDCIQQGDTWAVITDIIAVHSLKTGQVHFLFELNNSGNGQQISGKFRRVGNMFYSVTEV